MNPEAQRIAIAEACGWSHAPTWEIVRTEVHAVWRKGDELRITAELPDCLNDLNAMAEAEAMCIRSLSQDTKYVHLLEDIASKQNTIYTRQRAAISATAAVRAEAFLKTIGKWEEKP